MPLNYQDRIARDPGVVGGEAVIKGTRVTLRSVLASLAEGATTAEILEDFPTLTDEDVRAVIAFAAASAQEDLPAAGTQSWTGALVTATARKVRVKRYVP
jgi:uncharacterized protein (DUF433 family)